MTLVPDPWLDDGPVHTSVGHIRLRLIGEGQEGEKSEVRAWPVVQRRHDHAVVDLAGTLSQSRRIDTRTENRRDYHDRIPLVHWVQVSLGLASQIGSSCELFSVTLADPAKVPVLTLEQAHPCRSDSHIELCPANHHEDRCVHHASLGAISLPAVGVALACRSSLSKRSDDRPRSP